MKSTLAILGLIMLWLIPEGRCAQLSGHKSEAEIARMTPEQRVEEYCKEYVRHNYWHRAYDYLLADHVMVDGSRALQTLTRIINEFDPTQRKGRGREKDAACYAAEGLLGQLDHRRLRLRALAEGNMAIDALSKLAERLKTSHFDTAEDEGEYSRRLRYEGTLSTLKDLKGLSRYDEAIRDTLALRYKIHLSDDEILSFTNSLMTKDPYYPAWSKTEVYKDWSKVNEAGNPAQYLIIKDVEPFHKAYLQYKAVLK
jgi:hypothetical protein